MLSHCFVPKEGPKIADYKNEHKISKIYINKIKLLIIKKINLKLT